MQQHIIKGYARALSKGSIKTIVDLDETLKTDLDFQIHDINILVNEFNGIMPPNRISHYVMAFITQGSGEKIIGGHKFEIEADYALIIPPNMIHSTTKWSLDTSGYMLSFSNLFFEKLQFPKSFLQLNKLFKISIVPYCRLNRQTAEKVKAIFKEIQNIQNSNDNTSLKLLAIKLSELILLYQLEFSNDLKNKEESLFDSFVELIEQNYLKEKETSYYARQLAIHPNYLNRIVRLSSQFSAKEYVNNRIIQEAKYLLKSTSIPIKEIAYYLGFADYNYFSRFYKKLTNQTPLQFRNV